MSINTAGGESARTLEVWVASPSSGSGTILEDQCQSWLTDGERCAATRLKQLSSRNQHIVGRGMVRRLLSRRANCKPSDLVFECSHNGKPSVIAPRSAIRPFNISHTEGLVLVALSDRGEIGVDVESLSRRIDIHLAERYFAKPEVDYINSWHDFHCRSMAFIKVWTLKESFVKATGLGLSIPLSSFSFEVLDSDRPKIKVLSPSLREYADWGVISFSPAEGYLGAISTNQINFVAKDDQLGIQDFLSLV